MTRQDSGRPVTLFFRSSSRWCIAVDGELRATFKDEIEAVVWTLALAERKKRTVTFVAVPPAAISIGRAEYAMRKREGTAPIVRPSRRR